MQTKSWNNQIQIAFTAVHTYQAMDPALTHFDQQLGLIISTSGSSHLLRAHNENKSFPPLECPGECKACNCDDDID